MLAWITEDYFCAILGKIAASFKMPPDIAGVTLLALGNGAPDVFATIAAINQNNFGVAIGELVGAGVFITTAIVGSVALVSAAELKKFPFYRDVFFFIFGIIFVLIICNNGLISIWETVLLLVFYLFYVAFTVFVHLYFHKKPPLYDALNDEIDGYRTFHDGPPTEQTFRHLFRGRFEEIEKIYFGKMGLYDQERVRTVQHDHPPDFRNYESSQVDRNAPRWKILFKLISDVFAMLTKWNKKKLHQKFLYVFFYPFRVLFNLTIPSAKEKNWNKIFAVLYPMTIPLVFEFSMNGIHENNRIQSS